MPAAMGCRIGHDLYLRAADGRFDAGFDFVERFHSLSTRHPERSRGIPHCYLKGFAYGIPRLRCASLGMTKSRLSRSSSAETHPAFAVRLQIMRAERWHRELARLIRTQMFRFV